MTIPNVITVFRLFLVPIVIFTILGETWAWAFSLFAVAGVSDALDGYIARRFDMRSPFGAVLDPLVDKVLLTSTYVALAIVAAIPPWLACIVALHAVLVVLAFFVAGIKSRHLEAKPMFVGKVNTAVQFGFAGVVLGSSMLGMDGGVLMEYSAFLIVMLTSVTVVLYIMRWLDPQR